MHQDADDEEEDFGIDEADGEVLENGSQYCLEDEEEISQIAGGDSVKGHPSLAAAVNTRGNSGKQALKRTRAGGETLVGRHGEGGCRRLPPKSTDVETRISQTLGRVGPSIFLSSCAESVAFFCGRLIQTRTSVFSMPIL